MTDLKELAIEYVLRVGRFHKYLKDDLVNELELINLLIGKSIKTPLELRRHLRIFLKENRFGISIERFYGYTDEDKVCRADSKKRMTEGQLMRFRRNLLIHVGHQNGFSQRQLAFIFNLPRSGIAEILQKNLTRFS